MFGLRFASMGRLVTVRRAFSPTGLNWAQMIYYRRRAFPTRHFQVSVIANINENMIIISMNDNFTIVSFLIFFEKGG